MKTIGIIGGAGPAAGVMLTQLVIEECQRLGCQDDADFPRVLLWSEPFSDMLNTPDQDAVAAHLTGVLDNLQQLRVESIGIACNTLHGFLSDERPKNIVSLVAMSRNEMQKKGCVNPVILSSRTSLEQLVHTGLGEAPQWPAPSYQCVVDDVITAVLAGDLSEDLWDSLVKVSNDTADMSTDSVVMGCTELSLLRSRWCPGSAIGPWTVIDPLNALAKELVRMAAK